MGLDMYLSRKSYVKRWPHDPENQKHNVVVWYGGAVREDIKPERITHIVEEVAYWRKANQIHRWFVDNVQDGEDNCAEYSVSIDQLEELVNTCRGVLADHSKAEELLPSQGGFFFGDTSYDEYYFQDLEDTIIQLGPLIQAEKDGSRPEGTWSPDFVYQSSW